jgi:serine protease Do
MRQRRLFGRPGLLPAGLATLIAAAGVSLSGRPAAAQELRSLFQQVKPSVVVIRIAEEEIDPDDDQGGETQVEGQGSGVLISPDGKILTAAHVVQTAEQVEVQFVDGTKRPAKIVSSVPSADVALIQVDQVPPSAHTAVVGNSDPMQEGDRVFVVGAPFDLSYTLTAGYISGRRAPGEIQGWRSSMELLQTDAAINKGNSGGPLFNMKGEVIGICSSILTQSGGFEGLGFAVASNFARKVLLDNPAIWTGIDGLYIEGHLAAVLNVPQRAGILVQRVAKHSPAAALGLQAGRYSAKVGDQQMVLGGDIILSVNGICVGEKEHAVEQIDRSLGWAKAGGSIQMTVLRAGKIVKLQEKLPAGR